jgi:hypothetical protein
MGAFFNIYLYHNPPLSLLEDELGQKIPNNLRSWTRRNKKK